MLCDKKISIPGELIGEIDSSPSSSFVGMLVQGFGEESRSTDNAVRVTKR
jgi:hypothetical protein